MTIFGAIATITSMRARQDHAAAWLDERVAARIKKGDTPVQALCACRQRIAEAEASHDP